MTIRENQFLTNARDIEQWLRGHRVTEYMIYSHPIYTNVVEVFADCDLSYQDLSSIPVKFYYIQGDFNISYNRLSDLTFSPLLIEKNFFCQNNLLTSLEEGPDTVKGSYICSNNNIENLMHLPSQVNGSFYFMNNPKLLPYTHKSFKEIKEMNQIQKDQRSLSLAVGQPLVNRNMNYKI